MEDQPPVQNEKKAEPPKEKALDAPAPLGTTIAGPGGGPDLGLGLGLGGGGGFGSGGAGGGGSKYGWYASEIQNRIAEVVRNDARVRHANMRVVVRIWPDASGRITRATVSNSGDSKLDSVVQNQILTGLQLAEAPPSDVPLPIVMHLSVVPTR
jgi:outer membrane biosynthesis protein TonB